MAFFGSSKSKQEREADDARVKLSKRKAHRALMFPNGESDARRDCERINVLTHGKIAADKLFAFVADCKLWIFASGADLSERQFVDTFVRYSSPLAVFGAVDLADLSEKERVEGLSRYSSTGVISENEAYDVYVYLEGEARFYDDTARRSLKGTGASQTTPEAGARLGAELRPFLALYAAGVYADELPTGYGEFGLDVNNPIPTISVRGSERYLRRLRYDGHPITYQLVGDSRSKVTPGPIDNYSLSVGNKRVGSVFICAWHKRNSRKAPRGFTLIN